MVGNEKILVETDYDNIVLIDPNKVIGADGHAYEREVNQEDLVMYANLEAVLIPRTKLNIGNAQDDTIQTVTIATNNFANINFLNPGGKGYFSTEWSDELTGKDTVKGNGTNQIEQRIDKNSEFYLKQGIKNVMDTETFGISEINIDNNAAQTPSVSMDLIDVGGRTLFEKGDDSPYAAFFNLPYPTFYLTLKGYFGKAIRYQLILARFTSSLDPAMGNFRVRLLFYSYKYTILSDMNISSLFALPNMYNTTYTLTSQVENNPGSSAALTATQSENGQPTNTNVRSITVGKGYQKIKELYSEYKSKGLIPEDFPEISLPQLIVKLENFERNILSQLGEEDFTQFSDIENYITDLKNLQKEVYYNTPSSWFTEFIDSENFFIKNQVDSGDTSVRLYKFKKEIIEGVDGFDKITSAKNKLKKIIETHKKNLSENKTLGVEGKEYEIAFNISYDNFIKSISSLDVNWCATYRKRFGKQLTNTSDCFSAVTQNYGLVSNTTILDQNGLRLESTDIFQFNGEPLAFVDQISQMITKAKGTQGEIEKKLTKILSDKLQDVTGLGFKPTIKNIFAIIFASVEGFFRLMDDVHKQAFEKRYDKVRYNAIISADKDNANTESKGYVIKQDQNTSNTTNGNIQIYPWPKFFVKKDDSTGIKYELAYIGDPTLERLTRANDFDIWPEVQFLEEFIKADTQRDVIFNTFDVNSDEQYLVKRVSLNAVEFPTTNQSYGPKEEVKYYYEIMERLLIASSLSKLNRSLTDVNDIANVISDNEAYNILKSLGDDNPYIISKLKTFDISSFEAFESFLRQVSNQGLGESWQLYIRGEYVTPYLRELTSNDFNILPFAKMGGPSPDYNGKNIDKLKQFLSQSLDTTDFTDVAPFTNLEWLKNNLANSNSFATITDALTTNAIISFNDVKKQIMNFDITDNIKTKRPVVDFSFYNLLVPTNVNSYFGLTNYYYSNYNNTTNRLPTEGPIKYLNDSPSVIGNEQTFSMLNSPFMLNAIQLGVSNLKNNVQNPFIEAAYLFLNSLPLATLKERYKSDDFGDLDYIFASFKKFGATHRLPHAWILKYGSIWHRYKRKVEDNYDILSAVWNNTPAIENFDPVSNNPTTQYSLTINGTPTTISFQENISNLGFTVTNMNLGFYPKAINDIYYFVTGNEYFTNYSNFDIQTKLDQNLVVDKIDLARISYPVGVDLNDPTRLINVKSWYSLIKTSGSTEFAEGDRNKILVLPSFGSTVNQGEYECFNVDSTPVTLKTEILNNSAIFNGSSRLFWAAPHYGYFNIDNIVMPEYDEYFKEIYTGNVGQDAFAVKNSYSKIDELIPTFKKEILDKFEQEFLNFTKSSFNIPIENRGTNAYLKNFQSLMSQLLLVDDFNTNTPNQEVISNVWNYQTTKIGETITSFLENDVLFVYGNPSNFDRKVYNSLSNKTIVDPYTFEGYIYNSLPSALPGSVTLAISESLNPEAWGAMKKYVGVYTIPGMEYSDSGSTLTDFFIDMDINFNETNVKLLFSLIQIYGTQKLNSPTDKTSFKTSLSDYVTNNIEGFESNILNSLITILQKELPNVSETNSLPIVSAINSDVLKLELWEHFKSFNDKWIAGNDYKNKTLYEDVLFLDRASRNIGDEIYVDIFQIKNFLNNKRGRVLDLISYVLEKSKFIMMPMPAFVNYWGVTTPGLTETPPIESSADFANDLFGTFMNVDYRNSSPKLVCFYTDVPSEHLDMKDNPNYPYRTDAFNISIPDNSLRENLSGKKDWFSSNKCVAFNVDFGTRNQTMFKSMVLSQDNTQNTSESFKMMQDIADAAGGKTVAQQSQSLFNVYRSRSYSCTVFSMGNALIQPTMYFNLRHVPMFSGPYLILTVKHRISSGDFITEFTGVRVPYYSLPRTNNSLASLNVNLFKKIFSDFKNRLVTTGETSNNVIDIRNNILKSQDKIFQSSECPIDAPYAAFVATTQGQRNSLSITEIVNIIKQNVTNQDANLQKKIRAMVFSTIYLDGGTNQEVVAWNNNYGGAPLQDGFGIFSYSNLTDVYFQKQYICLLGSDGKTWPYATFETVEKSIGFLRDRFTNLSPNIDITNNETLAETLFNNWIKNWPRENRVTIDTLDSTNEIKVRNIKTSFSEAVNLMNSAGLF